MTQGYSLVFSSYRFSSGVLTDGMGYDMKCVFRPALKRVLILYASHNCRRKPAWTDRILHMTSTVCTVKQQSYTSHPTITMSDHRPISAEFEVEVKPDPFITPYPSFLCPEHFDTIPKPTPKTLRLQMLNRLWCRYRPLVSPRMSHSHNASGGKSQA